MRSRQNRMIGSLAMALLIAAGVQLCVPSELWARGASAVHRNDREDFWARGTTHRSVIVSGQAPHGVFAPNRCVSVPATEPAHDSSTVIYQAGPVASGTIGAK